MKWFAVVLLSAALAGHATGDRPNDFIDQSVSPTEKPNRIINGEPVDGNLAPYIVSLSLSSVVYAHVCAGIIIDRDWVLTTAHCVLELESFAGSAIGLPVYAGMSNRTEQSTAQIRTIDFAFKHKEFTDRVGSENIALVHVKPPFVFGVTVQQAWLPMRNSDFSDQMAATFGWGLINAEDNAFVTDLQMALGRVMNWQECVSSLPEGAAVNQNNICIAVTACYGDGGSPLVVPFAGGRGAELIGLASWGFLPCGYNNRPTIYTAVTPFIDWITEVKWAYYILN